jgi:hypothetical protein
LFGLRCAKYLSVMFGIMGKLRFSINCILTFIDFYAEIQEINRTTCYRSCSWAKIVGTKLDNCWTNTDDRFHTYPAYWKMTIVYVIISIQWKTTVYLHITQMENITDKKINAPDIVILSWSCHFELLIS